MKFMTPATLRNLPHYMADQRRQSTLLREEERYQDQQEKKKLTAEAGFELMETLDNIKSPDDFQSAMKTWGAKWKPVLGPEGLQMTSNMVRNFKEEQYQKEDRQKQLLTEQTAGADADAASRILGQKAGFINQNTAGGDDYSVPVSQEDLLLSMSPKGRLGVTQTLLGYQADQAKAESQAKKDALDMRYKEAQIQNLGKRQEATPMSYREWQLAGEPGTYEQWVNRNRTVGNEDTARADLEAKYDVYENTITVPKDQAQAVLRDVEASGFTAVPGKEITQDKPGWFTGDDELVEIKIGGYHGASRPGASQGGPSSGPDKYQEAAQAVTQMDPLDAAEGLLNLEEDDMERILSAIPPEKAKQILDAMRQMTTPAKEMPRGDAVPQEERRAATTRPAPDRLAPAKDVAGAVSRGLKPVGKGIDDWIRRIQK